MRIIAAILERISWLSDRDMKEVLSGASLALGFKILSAGLGFGFNVLLARMLGAEGAGIYYLALTVTTISTVVGRMGLDNALLRFTAASASQEKWEKVAGVYKKGILIALIASTIATITVILCSSLIAMRFFSEPDLLKSLRIMAFAIVPMSLLTLHGEMLKGLKKIREAMLVQGVGVPLVNISLLTFLGGPLGIAGAAISYVCATTLILFSGIVLWQRVTPQLKGIQGSFDTKLLLSTGIPLFLVASMNLVMSWTDTIMLGFWLDSKAVGIYNAALRTAMLTSFILIAMNTIAAPKFASLYAKGDINTLGNLARNTTVLMALVALPVLILFIFGSNMILSFFGSDFVLGSNVLTILALGQYINVATGSVGYLLMMTGYEKLMRNNIVITAFLNICLNLTLIPKYNIVGAAIATSISIIFMNLVSMILVYWKLSILTLPIPKGVFRFGK